MEWEAFARAKEASQAETRAWGGWEKSRRARHGEGTAVETEWQQVEKSRKKKWGCVGVGIQWVWNKTSVWDECRDGDSWGGRGRTACLLMLRGGEGGGRDVQQQNVSKIENLVKYFGLLSYLLPVAVRCFVHLNLFPVSFPLCFPRAVGM